MAGILALLLCNWGDGVMSAHSSLAAAWSRLVIQGQVILMGGLRYCFISPVHVPLYLERLLAHL